MSQSGFRRELQHLINCESMENGCDTPDFMLADYLVDCLAAFDKAVSAREKWYGRSPRVLAANMPFDPETPVPAEAIERRETETP